MLFLTTCKLCHLDKLFFHSYCSSSIRSRFKGNKQTECKIYLNKQLEFALN